jgi:hypothetical protein
MMNGWVHIPSNDQGVTLECSYEWIFVRHSSSFGSMTPKPSIDPLLNHKLVGKPIGDTKALGKEDDLPVPFNFTISQPLA